MKAIKLTLLCIATSLSFITTVQAGVHIKINPTLSLSKETACDQFVGKWSGNAVIEKVCKYSGTANVTPSDTAGRYNIHVELRPIDGYFWCPKSDPAELQGVCNGSDVYVDTPKSVHLNGNTNGHAIHLSGTVDAEGGKVLHVDSLDLNKQ